MKFKIIIAVSVMVLCLYGIISIIGTTKYQSSFCKEQMKFLQNKTNAEYWLIEHGDGFPPSCCTEGGYGFYERDDGTMTRFLLGATGRYMNEECEWVEDVVYEKPNIFTKIKFAKRGLEK